MTIKCAICQTESSDDSQYCEGCGVELTAAAAPVEGPAKVPAPEAGPVQTEMESLPAEPSVPFSPATAPLAVPSESPVAVGTKTVKLIVKKYGAYTGDELPIYGTRVSIGRFDPSTGPVDIDVTGMTGAEHVSRRHAELYCEYGAWKVRDLGSTNGIFIRRRGEAGFSPRLQEPATLADGDELAFGNVMFLFREG